MGALDRIDHTHLCSAVVGFRDALRSHQHRLNRLNVYPVPDGDTGTNMALTLESVVSALDAANGPDSDMAGVCRAISQGSLLGARGNSGVILSQVLRGLCQTLRESDDADGKLVALALATATTAAYGAVMRPVEGTILTVVREASEAATEAARAGRPLVEVVDAATASARDALARTPELLPVLAVSGVVDAGGAGFVLFLDALLSVIDGRPVPEVPTDEGAQELTDGPEMGSHGDASGGIEGPRYEVMFLLDAADDRIDDFKSAWAKIGDSIVVVGGDGLWNCHIHSDDIGASVEAGIEIGRPRQIRVTDLAEQVQEERWVRKGLGERPGASPDREHLVTAVVAVGLGEMVGAGLRSMGVQEVVVGGQTMNPSTADLLDAVEATDADEVVILPNNGNVVAVARQAVELASKPAYVVPTVGIVGGLAALTVYDPSAAGQANAKAMGDAAENVISGEVTWAVRDAGAISEGDWLGLAGDDIVAVDADVASCATKLLDRLVGEAHELVTIFLGVSTPAGATATVERWLAGNRPRVEVEVLAWQLPLSAYLFSIE